MILYNISRTTQCTNRDNTARNDNFTIWLLIESDWSQVIYIYRYENILQIGEGALGYRIDAEISSKAAPEKPQTTVSENRYTFPKIDAFCTVILSLLLSTENSVCIIFGTPGTAHLCYSLAVSPNVYAVSLHVWVSKYTCHPMITN